MYLLYINYRYFTHINIIAATYVQLCQYIHLLHIYYFFLKHRKRLISIYEFIEKMRIFLKYVSMEIHTINY